VKLPIKKKWLDRIKSGEKNIEWRAAHITFVCEETGEEYRLEITAADVFPRKEYDCWEEGMFASEREFQDILDDEQVIAFCLKRKR